MYGLARFGARYIPRLYRGLRRLARPRVLRRRPRVMRRKKTQNKVHSFVRWCEKDTLYGEKGPSSVTETGADQHLAYQFKLDNVVNPSDFTNLYDMYRINKIVLYLERFRTTTGDGSAAPFNGRISVVHDYNDANPLTGEDQYLEYGNCKRYSVVGSGPIKITLYPKINNVIENALGAANAYTSMNSNRVWLNMANDEVSHFGLKIMVPGGMIATEGYTIFRVRAKYWLSCKNSK